MAHSLTRRKASKGEYLGVTSLRNHVTSGSTALDSPEFFRNFPCLRDISMDFPDFDFTRASAGFPHVFPQSVGGWLAFSHLSHITRYARTPGQYCRKLSDWGLTHRGLVLRRFDGILRDFAFFSESLNPNRLNPNQFAEFCGCFQFFAEFGGCLRNFADLFAECCGILRNH